MEERNLLNARDSSWEVEQDIYFNKYPIRKAAA